MIFFSFDGIDGVGKTTQSTEFCNWLGAQGHDFTTCRDPGSTPLGEKIRDILLFADSGLPIARRSEMLLYMAARAQLVEEKIRPALKNGQIVVSDRYLLANLAYQAYAGGLDLASVRSVGQIATDGVMPDCVFLLDMAEQEATDRLGRNLDRMEQQGPEYRRKLRDGFLSEAARDTARIHVLDATKTIEVVQQEIRQIAQPLLRQS